jgi:hypothetical protein
MNRLLGTSAAALLVALSKTTTIATNWQLTAEAEVAPVGLGRLVVRLPEKYPGQDLVFAAGGLRAPTPAHAAVSTFTGMRQSGSDAGATD